MSAAGAVAQQLLARHGVAIVGWVDEVSGISAAVDGERVNRTEVDSTAIRCPDAEVAARMIERVERARKDGDSVGGIVRASLRPRGMRSGRPLRARAPAIPLSPRKEVHDPRQKGRQQ